MKLIVIKARFLILLLMAVVFASPVSAELKWLDKIIVLVESDVILDSEFNRKLTTIKKQFLANNDQLPSEDALKKQVLERMIIDQIQLQLGDMAGIRVSDAELNAALERIAEGSQATIAQMKSQLESEGINYSLFREDIRKEIKISRVRQGAVNRKVFVSEQEVDDILKIMDERGASSVQYHLRHLMIAISESADPNDVDEVRAKMAKIIQRYNSGEDFSQLVIESSDASDALTAGDLGWKTMDQLPTLFVGSVRNLEIGQLSEPIRSANGLHLLKLEQTKGTLDKQMVDEVNYRHILIKISAVTTEAKAKAKLISIRKEIIAGSTDFAEQAKVFSEDLATATLGGDLGWYPPKALQQLYRGQIDDLQDGELSHPFEGADGWFLVERLGSRVTDQTEEMKRMRARRLLQSRKFEEEQESWLREIREQAYVKILPENDS